MFLKMILKCFQELLYPLKNHLHALCYAALLRPCKVREDVLMVAKDAKKVMWKRNMRVVNTRRGATLCANCNFHEDSINKNRRRVVPPGLLQNGPE
jgi:hypothetical protein